MNKKRLLGICCGILLTLTGCGAESVKETGLHKEPIPESERVQVAPEQTETVAATASAGDTVAAAEGTAATASDTPTEETAPAGASTSARQDGERFEGVIMLEGMEETVQYEHAINDALGIEMDFEYDALTRRSGSDKESFISIYDDTDNPDNYLEVTYSPEQIDTVTASVAETLAKEYEISTDTYELDNAGPCTVINTISSTSGSSRLQEVYLIPAQNGTIVATAHFTFESAEGFGHRFSYMMNTLMITNRG